MAPGAAAPAWPRSSAGLPRSGASAAGRRLEVMAEPVVAWVDPAKVERVVENLLANADRHTTPDTPVWVRVARRDEGVLLAVEDAGGGVPQELRATLFEPFRQGQGRPRTPRGGHRPVAGGPVRRASRRPGVGAGPARRRGVVPGPVPRRLRPSRGWRPNLR